MNKKLLWTLSIATSALLFFCYCWLLYVMNKRYTPAVDELTSSALVKQYLDKHSKDIYSPELGKPIFVPTGLFIDSIKFVDPNTVNIAGYVWQKYSKDTPSNIQRGIVFPEATNVRINKAYEFKANDKLRIGWYFEGNFTQGFDYAKYPLDNKTIFVRLWAEDFEKNIILVPDLSAYDSTKPEDKFGLNSRYFMQGFSFVETYFNYRLASYDTNFGLDDYSGLKNFPELFFNIVIQRNMSNAIITNLIPLLVVLSILFGSLTIITTNKADQKKFGFSMSGILGLCSFMLFVVLTAHIRLRESVVSGNIIYLEYIYFIMYFATIYVAVTAFLTLNIRRNRFLDFVTYDDSLILKVLFLPTILAFALVISYICLR